MKAAVFHEFGAPAVLPLSQVAEAHRIMESTMPLGKIVLDPTPADRLSC